MVGMTVYIQGFVIGLSVRLVTFIYKVKRNVEEVYFLMVDLARKIFNRNTIKVSYFCMENVTGKCNCRKANECPLGTHCLESSLVYQAEVTTRDNGEIKHYVEMTANYFKERYRNHKKSFTNATYKNEKELGREMRVENMLRKQIP